MEKVMFFRSTGLIENTKLVEQKYRRQLLGVRLIDAVQSVFQMFF